MCCKAELSQTLVPCLEHPGAGFRSPDCQGGASGAASEGFHIRTAPLVTAGGFRQLYWCPQQKGPSAAVERGSAAGRCGRPRR